MTVGLARCRCGRLGDRTPFSSSARTTSLNAVILSRKVRVAPLTFCEEQVPVRVHATAEVEVGPAWKDKRFLTEDAELEDRHRDGLQFAAQAHFGAAAVDLAVTVSVYGVMRPLNPAKGPW